MMLLYGLLLTLSNIGLAAGPSTLAEQAAQEAQAGNYAIAYCLWQSLAAQGDADAMLNLGWMYHNGYGLLLNDHKALELWERAAAAGQPEAWQAIGNLYRLGGQGIRRDLLKAAGYLLDAAQAGVSDADPLARVVLSQFGEEHNDQRMHMLRKHSQTLGGQLRIRVPRANFRDQASLASRVLRVLPQDTDLTELNRNGDWVHAAVNEDALVGWIHSSLIAPRDRSVATP